MSVPLPDAYKAAAPAEPVSSSRRGVPLALPTLAEPTDTGAENSTAIAIAWPAVYSAGASRGSPPARRRTDTETGSGGSGAGGGGGPPGASAVPNRVRWYVCMALLPAPVPEPPNASIQHSPAPPSCSAAEAVPSSAHCTAIGTTVSSVLLT